MTPHTGWPGDRRPVTSAQARRTAVRVSVLATDPLVASGLLSMLLPTPGIELVATPAEAEVTVAVADAGLHKLLTPDIKRLVLITDDLEQNELRTAAEQGLIVLLPRDKVTGPPRLLHAIRTAGGGRNDLSADQFRAVLQSLERLQENTFGPHDLTLGGFSQREAEVIRLLADGLDTSEIAERLIYSERTVKNVLHNLLSRLNLRNRAHAVAYALRHGLI